MTVPNFSRRTEDFTCANCGALVRGTGYTNHCPRCLWSRHVDVRPGDRMADCGGMMPPIGALHEAGTTVVVQRCEKCGHLWRNKCAAEDDEHAIMALVGAVPHVPAAPRGGKRADRARGRRAAQGRRRRRR